MKNLWILFSNVSLNYISVSLLLPFIIPLIMEPSSGFLQETITDGTRGMLLGLIIGVSALAKFVSLPLLGSLSDQMGRKKVLLFSLILISFAAVLGFIAIHIKNIVLLIFSRAIDGIGAGNYAVTQASIADFYDEKQKTKNFALLNSACGAGYVLGPLIGSFTSSVSPFLVILLLAISNLLFVLFFNETSLITKTTKITLTKPFKVSCRAFQLPQTRRFFIMILAYCLGWGFFCEFLPSYLLKTYHFGSTEIGYFFTYIGAMIFLCQSIFIRPFINRFPPRILLFMGFICLTLFLPLLILASSSFVFFVILTPIVFFQTFIFPNAARILSDLSSKEEQGELMGTYQSLQAIGMFAGPFFFGSLAALYPNLSLYAGMLAPLSALFIALLDKKQKINIYG